jgi:class 3 adenylate cyclase
MKLKQLGKMGVNTGEVVRSIATGENHPEYTPIGHSTSLAARMQALSPTGSIAVTQTRNPQLGCWSELDLNRRDPSILPSC